MRDDQTGFTEVLEKVLQQNLRSKIQEVRWFVEQKQIRLMQEQRGQLHARLPSARQFPDRAFEVSAFEFKLPCDFTTLPIGLATISHQKFERSLARQERVMLTQIADLEARMANDLSRIELFVSQEATQKSGLSGAVSSDKPDLGIARDSTFGIVEQELFSVAFIGLFDLK